MSEFVDDREIRKILNRLSIPDSNKKNAARRALRKGANILKDAVRSRLDNTFNKAGKPFEEEAVNGIKRNIKVLNSKSKTNPGVVIYAKGSTISMGRGKTRREWSINGALSLILFGNYKSRPRITRGTKQERGNIKGIDKEGLYEPVAKQQGKKALEVAKRHLAVEINKEIRKLTNG